MDTNMWLLTIVGLLGLVVTLLIAVLVMVFQNHTRLIEMRAGGRGSRAEEEEGDSRREEQPGSSGPGPQRN